MPSERNLEGQEVLPEQDPRDGSTKPVPPEPEGHELIRGSSGRVGAKRVVHRKYRVRVRGAIPSDLSGRVNAAHATAIQRRPPAESTAKSA